MQWDKPILHTQSIVLYCIVLYLYIYIALLAVHTNQKRFQCCQCVVTVQSFMSYQLNQPMAVSEFYTRMIPYPTLSRRGDSSGRFGAVRPEGRRFESHYNHHVGTLGKCFKRTCSCL